MKRRVKSRSSAINRSIIIVVLKLGVLNNHETGRFLEEFLTRRRHLQQSIVLHVFLQIAGDERLPDDGIPQLVALVLARAEFLQLLMLMSQYLITLLTGNEVDDIVGTEVLFDGDDGPEHDLQGLLSLNLGLRMQTVIAVTAVILVVLLTKIVEQHLPTAYRRLSISSRLLQQLSADILLCHRLSFHEFLQFLQVLVGIKGNALTLPTVTASSSGFLIVALKALWNVIVDDKAHVGLVDSHAEGNGGHDDVNLLH